MGLFDSQKAVEALERIASALEYMAAERKPLEGSRDESGVSYVKDEDEVRKEVLREAYYQRTGIDLPEDELPPKPRGWIGEENSNL
jgi:hypothetical protein